MKLAAPFKIATLFSLLLAQSALASEAPMRITDVRFSVLNDPTQIEIVGDRFDNGAAPVVTLDGAPITVHASSATLIEAELPGVLPDGEYMIGVVTGTGAKQTAEHGLSVLPLIPMTVSCVDWFITAGHGEHIHNELHIEDEDGFAVLGANVTYTTAYRSFEDRDDNVPPVVFQTNVSATTNTAGHNHGEGCVAPTGSGVTGWFCCIGAGKWDSEVPPGKRACEEGTYTARIVSVEAPASTNMVFDERSSEMEASFDLEDPKFP
jgi:hypothetical protein